MRIQGIEEDGDVRAGGGIELGKTKIEWTEYSWNPVSGCTPASEGCQNCYAKHIANRLRGRCGYPADDPFKVTMHEDRLGEPLRWKKPRRVFVCSMGDLFHDDVPEEFLNRVFANMAIVPQHIFMVLTKRPERMAEYISANNRYDALIEQLDQGDVWDLPTRTVKRLFFNAPREDKWPLPNVWLGVTAENQQRADERIPILLEIPAAVRFVSIEPMLGPVDIAGHLGFNGPRRMGDGLIYYWVAPKLDWVICGGETGPGARPMHPDWVRNLRNQCQEAGVPFFFKQWGEYCSPSQMPPDTFRKWDIQHGTEIWDDEPRWRVGKKAAGRMLDGEAWDEMPEGRIKT